MKGIWKYGSLLPPAKEETRVSLGEGGTPLIRSRYLGPSLGLKELYFKLETLNPSGSYKDRFAASAVASLLGVGTRHCFATSSGNTGAALAAYCAAAGIRCFLLIVDGAPAGKLQQMQVYGAETLMIRDFGKDYEVSREVMEQLTHLAARHNSPVQISAYAHSPEGMAGVQTIAYEIAEDLPVSPEHVFVPAGGGGLTLAVVNGFHLWKESRPDFAVPRVHCVQPGGNDTIAGPLREGKPRARKIDRSLTSISGLQVPNVLDGNKVVAGCRASGGNGHLVEDGQVYECQHLLAVREGIFCEPAGAVAFAGLRQALQRGEIDRTAAAVCLVTGHGFKDPASAQKIAERSAGHSFGSAGAAFRYMENEIKKT